MYCRILTNRPFLPIRPLQINSLFPVHRPHLVTASSKYSIILYSSIIFRLFLHTDRLSKSYLETVSAHVSAVLSSQHKLHVCVIFATYKGRNKLRLLQINSLFPVLDSGIFACGRAVHFHYFIIRFASFSSYYLPGSAKKAA